MKTGMIAAISTLVLAGSAQSATPAPFLLPQALETELALEAGPEPIRAGAALYLFGADGYRRVREGSNGFTCLVNRDGNRPCDATLHPTCWDAEGGRTIVQIVLRVGELIARSAPAEEIAREVEAGFASGRFHSPAKAGIAYMLRGDVRFDPLQQKLAPPVFPPHYMIYAPGVTGADIGAVPNAQSRYALPSVFSDYSGGSRTAYIIVLATEGPPHLH